jgi:hypothetical protein
LYVILLQHSHFAQLHEQQQHICSTYRSKITFTACKLPKLPAEESLLLWNLDQDLQEAEKQCGRVSD